MKGALSFSSRSAAFVSKAVVGAALMSASTSSAAAQKVLRTGVIEKKL